MSDPIPKHRAFSSGTALFVRRPILAIVLNSLIVMAGIAGLFGAEIRELPNVDRPVVTITTPFPGASPETVDQELTGRIEGAVGRVSGVRTISSNSRYARSRVTVEFQENVDIDVAATDVRQGGRQCRSDHADRRDFVGPLAARTDPDRA
jgi:hydrophobic/amphiphilic exporter-1 (mainly G- bacteria), HAE1 family